MPNDPLFPDEQDPLLTGEALNEINDEPEIPVWEDTEPDPLPELFEPEIRDDSAFSGDNDDFNDLLMQQEPEAEPEPSAPRPPHKGRPKRRKGEGLLGIPNILVTAVWLALVVAIGITLGRMIWICAAEVLAFGREDKTVVVTVYENDSIDDITDKLYKSGLVRYPGLFKLYAKFAVDDGEIHAGMWDLNTQYDYHALVKMMSPSSSRQVVKVMIPEGYNCRQIFDLLQDNKVCTALDLGSYAASGELEDYWFLKEVERGSAYCLEGFLFPDTYEFYTNETPRNVLEKMLDNFDTRFDADMMSEMNVLNDRLAAMMRADGRSDDYIAAHRYSVQDIVNIAAMVEKEMATADESSIISSVIYNRLCSWGSTPAYLNIDATVIYALGGKTNLTAEDLQVDSPYNTYTHTGLPPTAIANPGLTSIRAAISPASTGYYYYVLDPATGEHHFSKTLAEHEAFRATLG